MNSRHLKGAALGLGSAALATTAVLLMAWVAGIGPFADEDSDEVTVATRADGGQSGDDPRAPSDGAESSLPPSDAPIERVVIEGAEIDNSSVITLGLQDDQRTFEVPTNATQVAWYDFSGLPGEHGKAPILAAHVDYGGQKGVFWSLTEADPGTSIFVVMADGSAYEYEVLWNRDIAKSVLSWEDVGCDGSQCFVSHALTVITCGGNFNPRTRSYNENVVVRAALVRQGDESIVPEV